MIKKRLESIKRPESKQKIQEMFVSVARRYDITNTLISFGFHYSWKRYTVGATKVKRGDKALDVCAGTCDLAIIHAKIAGPEGRVTAVDFTPAMLDVGEYKIKKAGFNGSVECVVSDAHDLPVGDETFDVATIATATRHLNLEKALSEIYRALKPGGRFASLDFFQPPNPVFRRLYDFYSYYILPRVGRLMTGDKTGVYEYLPDSIRVFYTPEQFKEVMEKVGFKNVTYKPLTGGIAYVHSGRKEDGKTDQA